MEGIPILNKDQEILRLEQIIRDGIEPNIPSSCINIHSIEISNNNFVLLIRIRKSWLSPHRISFKKSHKFYSRSTNGKYLLDIQELRSAFILSETLTEKIRNFREDRISKIISDEIPLPLYNEGKMILHLIPFSSFEPGKSYEIELITKKVTRFKPMFTSQWDNRYNLDGYLVYFLKQNGRRWATYTQLFRNGIIEAAEDFFLNKIEDKILPITSIEEQIINSINNYIEVFQIIEVDPPIFVFLTITGVRDYYYPTKEMKILGKETPIERDILNLPEIIIEKIEIVFEEIGKIMRPCFDSIWNSCGISKSPNYDENGEWKKTR